MFWIISAILILIALAFVLPSLLRQRRTLQDGSREQNIFIANEQLKDLETRFEKGEIDSDAYQSTRDELEQSLFSDIKSADVNDEISTDIKKPSFLGAVLIALLIPAIAIPVYLFYGKLEFTKMLDSKQAAAKVADAKVPRNADGTPDIDTMIAGLQKRMEADPKNEKGWMMLGRSYMVLKRYPEAANSYERALKLKPQSADLMLALADSLAMVSNGEITGRPIELINKALEIEPENRMALWLGGMVARQQGKYLIAIERWRKVLPMVKTPNERKEVNSLITEAITQLTPEQKEKMGASIAPNPEATSFKTDKTPSTGITVSISLSEKFKAQAKPTDLVFIYAKAMSGPPMPLAAVRKQVKDLPLEVVLNDEMAMMPNLKLSGFSEVIVGARVSKTGQPVAQNGDLFSEKASVKAGDKVSLEINTVVVK